MAGVLRLIDAGRRRRTPRRAAVAFLGLLALPAAAAAQENNSQENGEPVGAPIAVRSSVLTTPPELAGSGIDPEVSLRVAIDAAGAVTSVEVLEIDPPSEFDDLLRNHVRWNIAGWRYGPARDANDNPVPSTLSWRMKFRSPEEARADRDWSRNFDAELGVLVAPGGLPTQQSRLTPEERARALTRLVEVAEQKIDREHRRRLETQRFIVITDAEDESVVDILAGNMESIFSIFHAMFDAHLEPLPEHFRSVVYLFRSEASFRQVASALGIGGRPGGFYRSPGFLAFHQEVNYFDQLLHTVLHEAFRAFSDSHLRPPGRTLPRWVEEGLAEYFANSKIQKGRLVPGKVMHGKYAIAHGGGARRLQSVTNWNLNEARSALRRREAPTVAELLEATRTTFYGDRREHYYGFSWLFVHFLHHGREEWEARQPLGEMLLYLTEGYSGRDALEIAFGVTPNEVQSEFERYVRRF